MRKKKREREGKSRKHPGKIKTDKARLETVLRKTQEKWRKNQHEQGKTWHPFSKSLLVTANHATPFMLASRTQANRFSSGGAFRTRPSRAQERLVTRHSCPPPLPAPLAGTEHGKQTCLGYPALDADPTGTLREALYVTGRHVSLSASSASEDLSQPFPSPFDYDNRLTKKNFIGRTKKTFFSRANLCVGLPKPALRWLPLCRTSHGSYKERRSMPGA